MNSKKIFLCLVVLGATLGGFLGYFDGSGVPIGILSGSLAAALLYGLILLFLLRRESDPFASIKEEERRASKNMPSLEKRSPTTNVTQASAQERSRLPPFRM